MSINEKFKISLMSLLIICGFAVYVGIFYHSYLTADTVYMLYQTNGMAEFSNWHPAFSTHFLGFLYDFLGETGLVSRIPTAVLCASIAICALLSLTCGLIVDNMTRARHELKRLAYLIIPWN